MTAVCKTLKIKINNEEGFRELMTFTEVDTIKAVLTGAASLFIYLIAKVSRDGAVSIHAEDVKKHFKQKGPVRETRMLPGELEIPVYITNQEELNQAMKFSGAPNLSSFVKSSLSLLKSLTKKVSKNENVAIVVDINHLRRHFAS